MKKILLAALFIIVAQSAVIYYLAYIPRNTGVIIEPGSIEPHFSPHGGCTETVVREINASRKTIQVQAYSFTSRPICDALIAAKNRGVVVTLIVDKGQTNEAVTAADDAKKAKIATYIDRKHAIAHNKIMLIDGVIIITGSFNFTAAAENSNAENLLVIHGHSSLYDLYHRNFEAHLSHSDRY